MGANEKKEKLNPFELERLAKIFIRNLRSCSKSTNGEVLDLLRNVFIYREGDNSGNGMYHDEENEKIDSNFSKLLCELGNKESMVGVLQELVNLFPTEEPHFHAHLARLCNYWKEYELAHKEIDKAINILELDDSRKDYFIFYHIKGMCYRRQAYDVIDRYHGSRLSPGEATKALKDFKYYFEQAEYQFGMTRKYAPYKEHGYISYVQFVIKAIDFGYSISNFRNEGGFASFLTQNTDESRWYQTILGNATDLLNKLRSMAVDEQYSFHLKIEQTKLQKFYDQPDRLISLWRRFLNDPNIDHNHVRRNIVNVILSKSGYHWENINQVSLREIQNLLFDSIKHKPIGSDIRMWFEATRRLNINTESIIKSLRQCEYYNETTEAVFYLYSLLTIKALAGAPYTTADEAKEFSEKCRSRSNYSNHVFCPEWVGKIDGTCYLVHHKNIGVWNKTEKFFEEEAPEKLAKLKGIVKRYENRKQGKIELLNDIGEGTGIETFYAPGSANHYKSNEMDKVEFYLGFGYYGPRAFKVASIYEEADSPKTESPQVASLTLKGQPKTSSTEVTAHNVKPDQKIKKGMVVECKIDSIYNNKTVFVKVYGIHERCSIYYQELGSYKIDKLRKGQVLTAKLIDYDKKYGWQLSANLSRNTSTEARGYSTVMETKLKQLLESGSLNFK